MCFEFVLRSKNSLQFFFLYSMNFWYRAEKCMEGKDFGNGLYYYYYYEIRYNNLKGMMDDSEQHFLNAVPFD